MTSSDLRFNEDGIVSSLKVMACDFPPINWLVEDYLPPGLTILHGKSKIGKSLLALQLCRAVTSGSEIFSKKTRKGKVLYVALESNPRRAHRRMRQQGSNNQESIDFIFPDQFYELYESLEDYGRDKFFDVIRRRLYDLVIVDTFSKAFPIDQIDKRVVYKALNPFYQFATSLDMSMILIDHEPKYGNTPYGSEGKQAVSDNIWRLYREYEKYGIRLSMVGRDTLEDVTLMLEKTEGSGLWSCTGIDTGFSLTYEQEKIIEIIRQNEKISGQEVANKLGKNRSNTHGKLQTLANLGVILKHGEGKEKYYSMPI